MDCGGSQQLLKGWGGLQGVEGPVGKKGRPVGDGEEKKISNSQKEG